MPRKQPQPIERLQLTGVSTVVDIAATDLLDELSRNELVVYLRLVAARATTYREDPRMLVRNRELHRDARSVGRALQALHDRGLVCVRFRPGDNVRTVELL